MFNSSLVTKPVSVAINVYFLSEYGYIYCNVCNTILIKNAFYPCKNTWHGFKHYCIDCQKYIRNNEDSQKYIRNNRDKYNAYLAKYRASKLQAAPCWLTKEQLNDIREFYSKAKEQG